VKILVAEDNLDSRELLSEILMSLGYEVVFAYDGVNALEKINQTLPDLCILDVDMPRKTGFEVVEALKQDSNTANIPIIMLTARGDVESRVTGLGLGADDYLAKPFSPRELMARVTARLRAKAETDGLRQQQELIRSTFSRFVAQEVIDWMLANPSAVQLGGHIRPVTVFFADLEGFTAFSERHDPSEVLDVLNHYHSLMVAIIQQNGGTLDKFLGDGLMALFNAPIDLEDHIFRAVKTALEIRQAIEKEQDSRFRLSINMGIHTGTALVGNVGAPDLMDYTAVGDTVNLAARLQGLSSKNQITISQAVYDAVDSYIFANYVGELTVKGREESVVIYHVTDFQ
jgi:adenylate cyclase